MVTCVAIGDLSSTNVVCLSVRVCLPGQELQNFIVTLSNVGVCHMFKVESPAPDAPPVLIVCFCVSVPLLPHTPPGSSVAPHQHQCTFHHDCRYPDGRQECMNVFMSPSRSESCRRS
jgi:hypothetical protein